MQATRRVILVGSLGAHELRELSEYCTRSKATGLRTLYLDLSAVTTCDQLAFEGIVALTERRDGLAVVVSGARWRQFIAMLGAADVAEVRRLHTAARDLVLRPGL